VWSLRLHTLSRDPHRETINRISYDPGGTCAQRCPAEIHWDNHDRPDFVSLRRLGRGLRFRLAAAQAQALRGDVEDRRILGCVPLALASGASANARISIGTVVIGGLLVATMVIRNPDVIVRISYHSAGWAAASGSASRRRRRRPSRNDQSDFV
jgi:hypothetical protein